MKLRITVNNTAYDVDVEVLDDSMTAAPTGRAPAGTRMNPAADADPTEEAPAVAPAGAAPRAAQVDDDKELKSPLAGNVVALQVKPGDQVTISDTLLVLESMKMESNIASPIAGTIAEVLVSKGQSVSSGQALIRFA